MKKEDRQIIGAGKEIQRLGNVLKLAASFKDMPNFGSKHNVLKDPEDKKDKETKKVWVVKEKVVEEKQVEDVKMLSAKIAEPSTRS